MIAVRVLVCAQPSETLRQMRRGKKLRVFNFACGPAVEIQEFLRRSPLASNAEFCLADFNQETLDYARRQFQAIRGFSSAKNAFIVGVLT